MSTPLHIRAAGMVTAVGLDCASAAAAMRARLDGFRETRFIGAGGEWLIGAPVPLPRNWIGEKRLAHLAAGAIVDAFSRAPEALSDCTLILCLPEKDRPGRPIRDDAAFAGQVRECAGLAQTMRTHIVAHGRPSGFVALDQARRMLSEGRAENVLVLGVDSYLTTLSVAHYLSENRLLTPANANGFIPGEGAAAVLCSRRGALKLTGLGLAREKAHIYNRLDKDGLDLPLRADGMTAAYQAAFIQSGLGHSDIGIKIGDLIGESFWFKQTALSMLRTQRERSGVQPIWPIAASLGNIGAAVVPLMLGWAFEAQRKGYSGGRPILIEASADDGACAAAIAEVA
ncbi:beta-ketoacyl synthase N-terminal-like domain-containing protein [Paracoccus marinaquae]|uniref:3-oxoacyl-ACP synthase n=1 Tax=Paracoccus marinaquae TaxID=2841926 RepID=A0ABS6APE7_9RHOB|nr:beta-ketoacyl synthase N-terminal-like domain-containing protein [Paracoccus marinaquae]MBU3031495.1 3-oxoacyl-ACP synthase [Paracoccus marinaquae]